MTLIGLLVAFTVSGIIGSQQRSAIARAKSQLALLAQALEDYKRYYGDYPQTGAAAQASAVPSATIGATQAQALLFNALTGVYGPTNFTARVNGPIFVDVQKFTLEVAFTPATLATFGVPTGSPPAKQPLPNAFLDPWGSRYIYYYKRATVTLPNGQTPTSPWAAPAYVLYSAGPDQKLGTSTTGTGTTDNGINVSTGLYTGTTQSSGYNADNIYADKLP